MRGKRLAVLLVLCAAGCAVRQGDIEVPGTTTADGNAAVTAPAPVAKTAVLEGFSAPESVYFAGGRVFVSNMGTTDRSAKDGDGFLSELTSAGAMAEPKTLPREGDPVLNAPKGMAHIGNRLYVADVDRIVGYDMDTREQVFEAPMATARLLNGLAVLNPTTLLVTDTLASSLYQLDLDSRQFALDPDGLSIWIPSQADNRVVLAPLPATAT